MTPFAGEKLANEFSSDASSASSPTSADKSREEDALSANRVLSKLKPDVSRFDANDADYEHKLAKLSNWLKTVGHGTSAA